MKGHDPLLGAPRERDALTQVQPPGQRRRRWPSKLAWATYGHIAFGIAAIIGWEHLDLLWPTAIWPDGMPVGAERRVSGLLRIGDRRRPAMLASSADLIEDWRTWVRGDVRQHTAECLAIPEPLRAKLLRGAKPRAGSAGFVQYWVDVRVRDRLGPARCGQEGGLQIVHALEKVEAVRPVSCSRDVFVAHGLVCPGERRSALRQSETLSEDRDYYPSESERREQEGKVTVRVERDETGSPVQCTLLQSSGHHELDRQTCKLVGIDPNFTFVRTEGSPDELSRPIIQTIVWRLPEEEPDNK